jgi:hypothetical protein
MDFWLITVLPVTGLILLASRIFPGQFKWIGRWAISLPLGSLFLFLLLAIFDAIHHLVGLVLHLLLKTYLWLFYDYHFTFHIKAYLMHFWHTHAYRVFTELPLHKSAGHMVLAFILYWFAWVAIFFAQEGFRVTFKEAGKTILRDQVYIIDRLYRFVSGLLELSLGRIVDRARRFVSDKEMQDALKKAVQKTADDRFES